MMQPATAARLWAANGNDRITELPVRSRMRDVFFAGLVIAALSGAFLIGLAVVGLLAGVISACELIRRQLRRPAKLLLGVFNHQVVG
jgi:hypothetical protein